ncbi:MAG: cytochrome-c peroxidase [Bacteroidales bacterium]|jgi:cytochrome c peroxidase|nr:cytochrome-c peroxidase [Bacteroidales bacterium]
MKKYLIILSILVTAHWSCNQAPKKPAGDKFPGLLERAKTTFSPLEEVADNPENPITPQKVLLGQTLYFDKRLSNDETVSCNSCHDLQTYGVDNESTSDGVGGQKGARNSPTVLNAAYHFTQFWDGRAKDVEEQAGGPILNPIEMAMPDQEAVIKRLQGIKGYQEMFYAAFPGEDKPVNYVNLQKAIGAFERKLITPSRFDEYLMGYNEAMSEDEKKGLQTFMDVGCTACHSGTVLGGQMYQKFGLAGNYWDFTRSEKLDNGRFLVTNSETDKFLFKVPSLRNIEKTHPFFHDGSITDLGEAVKIIAKLQLNKDLTEQEVKEIVTFLKTLTGTVPADLAKAPEMPV